MQYSQKAVNETINKLSPESILTQSPYCTVREQELQYLIYNTHSDEMHLISPVGHYIYQLCNGINSVEEISGRFSSSAENNSNLNSEHDPVVQYLKHIFQRGLVQIACYE